MLTSSEKQYLLDSMSRLLIEYDYDYDIYVLEDIIDEWASQKGWLIEAFNKHPNYVEGKFMIAFDADYERKIECEASVNFRYWVIYNAMPKVNGNYPEAVKVKGDYFYGVPYDIYSFFNHIGNYAARCISESTAKYLNDMFTELRFHEGQKTSRVVNKICQYLGYDKVDGYNREFAKYADSLSPLTIKRHTILSINPLDYLTMSFGNSWASCHTIDKKNKRNMPNSYSGCYSSGTISYMLDEVSMVLYTVDASYNGTEYWDQPKINRQMFHYGEEKLIQSRLYPQDNDGYNDVYTPYRNIVQQIISTIFDFPNLWSLNKGTHEACKYIRSDGTHYPDYCHFESVTTSRIKGSENEERMTVGAQPICIVCGERHWDEENISHCARYVCADCGRRMDEDDVYWVNGESYCSNCVEYCDYCNEYHTGTSTYVEGHGYICEDCLERHFTYCERCGAYELNEDAYYIECEDRYVCEGCLHTYYTQCDDCCEYFPDEEICYHNDLALCESCYDNRVENGDIEIEEDEE